jgi:DNA helicase-2/ATP-dependent DNA helicase PcrA
MRGLYLVYAFRRTLYGSSLTNAPSRFLADVPRAQVLVTHGQGRPADGAAGVGAGSWLSRRENRVLSREQMRDRLVAQHAASTSLPRPNPSGPRRPRPSPTGEPTYRPGDSVRHPSFGTGIVVSSRLEPGSEIVEVNFAGPAGVKRLDLAYAPLERA